eukprot:TRINITY_DN6869_c0_g1_i1.p1 TRINITY_DN6869_c0_g1~~TRINITY_DN6869_c0_g1_i1.p1  ORF type:complete len:119 (+),score=27.48 TRINITY_DN6869_c0_g1_i1:232-588(+)
MAALSINHPLHIKKSSIFHNQPTSRIHRFLLCCRGGGEPIGSLDSKKKEKAKEEKPWLVEFYGEFEKLGRGLKESLSPKQKGDWRDLMLMSLSFAVYVYISQKIVCAYCAWMSMIKHL